MKKVGVFSEKILGIENVEIYKYANFQLKL